MERLKRPQGYCTDVFFRQALGWIKQNRGKPFFAYLPTNAPHGPVIVAENYRNLFKDKTKDIKDAAFLGMIVNIDENMGLLMEKLNEWELANDTLLVFMTDNGTAKGSSYFNAGMKGDKGSLNEGGSRVPLFMRWPDRLPAGRDIDRMTRHFDLFPTFTELAGAKLPKDLELDGRSLVPLLESPESSTEPEWPDRYTSFHRGCWAKEGAPGRFGKGNFDPDKEKYTRFAVRNQRFRLVGKNTLYDISKDPGEATNVLNEHPEVAERMLQAYDKWWDSVRPLMINEDAPLDTGKPFIEQFEKQQKEDGIPQWSSPEL